MMELISSWLPSWLPAWADPGILVRRVASEIVRTGHIPRHVAFIMDGNRRFARRSKVETIVAHSMGFDTLKNVLEWCMDLNVEVVTVYAFSIENFKRPKDEVDNLMRLAKDKFTELLDHSDMLQKYGISVRMLGDLTLLPQDVQAVLARVVVETAGNKNHTLNVCMCYTAQEEMARSIHDISEGVESGALLASDVTEELIEQCLYTGGDPPLDLCVRTSGEVRLSDFLLWQNSYAILVFLNVMWPELRWWHLMYSVLQYSIQYPQLEDIRRAHRRRLEANVDEVDRKTALARLRKPQEALSAKPAVQSNGVPELASEGSRSSPNGVGHERTPDVEEYDVNMYLLESTQLDIRRRREARSRLFVAELGRQRLEAIKAMSEL